MPKSRSIPETGDALGTRTQPSPKTFAKLRDPPPGEDYRRLVTPSGQRQEPNRLAIRPLAPAGHLARQARSPNSP